MTEWLVELKGDTAELEYLCSLSPPKWRVTEQGGRYYLRCAVFDSSMDARNVLADASRILDVMNGVGRLVLQKFEGAKVHGINRIEENGRQTQFIMPSSIPSAERLGIPAVTVPSGQESSQPFSIPGSKWIEIAEKDLSADKALALYGGLEHNWRNLYMVLEVVEGDVGGENGLLSKGWAHKAKIKLFKRTANSFLKLGYQARHATAKYKAPRIPMSLDDAQSLIKNILTNWLCSK